VPSRNRERATNGPHVVVQLLRCANCTQEQTRRLLTAIGELAQLAAWVAADSDQPNAAFGYVRGGVLAAHAAGDTALAGNIEAYAKPGC